MHMMSLITVLRRKFTTGNPDHDAVFMKLKKMDRRHLNSGSETTSLDSRVWHYKYENGRRYHTYSEGQYWGPNDEKQNEQLDIL